MIVRRVIESRTAKETADYMSQHVTVHLPALGAMVRHGGKHLVESTLVPLCLFYLLLSIVGGMMITESVRAILRARGGRPAEIRRPGSHLWIHGLPLKMRFKVSKIYVSVIPIWTIGFIIGFIGAVMGIGGGFLLVPALIYLIRVPTGVVIGTSMVLTLVTMAYATIIHAATNHLVDALLALLLMTGGVIGAQFGARAGQRFSGEQLRLLLGVLVLSVGLRFAYDLVVQPTDLFSMRTIEEQQ